jgi:hypothetical protein
MPGVNAVYIDLRSRCARHESACPRPGALAATGPFGRAEISRSARRIHPGWVLCVWPGMCPSAQPEQLGPLVTGSLIAVADDRQGPMERASPS